MPRPRLASQYIYDATVSITDELIGKGVRLLAIEKGVLQAFRALYQHVRAIYSPYHIWKPAYSSEPVCATLRGRTSREHYVQRHHNLQRCLYKQLERLEHGAGAAIVGRPRKVEPGGAGQHTQGQENTLSTTDILAERVRVAVDLASDKVHQRVKLQGGEPGVLRELQIQNTAAEKSELW